MCSVVAREPHHEPRARGRVAGGPGRRERAAVRRAPRDRRAGARAFWRLTSPIPFELRPFEIPKHLKFELHSKTYEYDYCRVINPLHHRP
jgi:hypothetical protein